MHKHLVDANYVLRWFLGDVPKQAAQVERLLVAGTEHSITLDRISMAEVTYVLRSQGYDHTQVTTVLQEFLRYPSVAVNRTDALALDFFAATTLDFEDCWLAAKAHNSGATVATFDKQLLKFIQTV